MLTVRCTSLICNIKCCNFGLHYFYTTMILYNKMHCVYIYIIPLEWTYKQLIQINLQFIVNKIICMSILVLISNKLMIFGITGAWEFICYMFTSNNKKYSAFIFKCIHIYYIYIFANIIIIFNINILLYMVMLDEFVQLGQNLN